MTFNMMGAGQAPKARGVHIALGGGRLNIIAQAPGLGPSARSPFSPKQFFARG